MAEAPAFSVVADVAIVKGQTPAADRTWLTFPDGTARRAVVHVIHDLPHLVVESVFALDDGRWGTLAASGFSHTAPAMPQSPQSHQQSPGASQPPRMSRTSRASRHRTRLRLVNGAPLDDLAPRNRLGHLVAKAAVDAVINRWGDGPDTPAGVRARLRCSGPAPAELAGRLDDETIRIATVGVRRLYRDWSALPPGGTLRLTWPLHASWLRLL